MSAYLVRAIIDRWLADNTSRNPNFRADALAALEAGRQDPNSIPVIDWVAQSTGRPAAKILERLEQRLHAGEKPQWDNRKYIANRYGGRQ